MPRVLVFAFVLCVVTAAVAVSRQSSPTPSPFQAETAVRNPWTAAPINAAPDQFQFAIVSDRTGGHRAKVFSQAVHRINLLQPEFVMSVGDLIEGYTQKKDVMDTQWNEFDQFIAKFEMPFFRVPGNHDITNSTMAEYWKGRYGKSYYHFTYKNVLFLAVNSEDGSASNIAAAQNAALKKALDENRGARWVLLFVHKPLWAEADLVSNGWAELEANLLGRNYTAFCGHVHRYQKYVRNGMNHYQLATTGGGSKLRGVEYGEFDHFTWVTMKPSGPLLANVMLDGVLPENLKQPETAEEGVVVKAQPTLKVRATVTLDGKPLAGATVRLAQTEAPKGFKVATADGLTNAAGVCELSTYKAFDGVAAGKHTVAVVKSKAGLDDGHVEDASNDLPAKYAKAATSGLVIEIQPGTTEFALELTSK